MSRPWIQTSGGAAIDLLNPDPASIILSDLVWALAHINRYTGHVGLYSVAQHSVLVARALQAEGHSEGVQRAGLMHDAHEAIVGDCSSPMKRAMVAVLRGAGIGAPESPYDVLERRAWLAVASRFGLPRELPTAVKVADLRALMTEARDLFRTPPPASWGVDAEPYPGRVIPWTAARASEEFHREAGRLGVV